MSEVITSTVFATNTHTAVETAFVPNRRVRERPAKSLAMDAESTRLARLMERYACGDASVFDELYRKLAPRLHRFCTRLTLRQPEADDCFQETFLRLHRARATYIAGANVLHWAYAIARSVYLSRLRYWRRRPERVGASEDIAEREDLRPGDCATPETEVAAEHLLDVATSELARMSEKNRSAYVLLTEENVSVREAAAVLGTTVDAVKQRAHRASEQIRGALREVTELA